MSVIPFVLDGSQKTVVETRQEFQQEGGLEGSVILIQNLQRDQIANTESGNASYDLRIGNEYKDHNNANKRELLDGEVMRLGPGSAIIVETMETVRFPKYRFGHILPKVSLLQRGISNTSSKIDPGYDGSLLVTVFNLGKKTIELKKGEKFCTLYVLDIGRGVIAYEKRGKKLPGNSSSQKVWAKIADYVEMHPTLFSVLLNITTTILTVATILVLFQQLRQSRLQPQLPVESFDENIQ